MERVNWAGTYAYRALRLHRPSTVEQVREIVGAAHRVRVIGSRHSFSDIADSAELLTLDGLAADVEVDHEAGAVSFAAGLSYGELFGVLRHEGLALANLASLPHISVAGATATATHGSGDANGNLATAVSSLELVSSEGEVVSASRGDPDFSGMVVGLGALGAVTRITLDVEPAYQVRQRVFESLRWESLLEHFDAITASGYSVSVFTLWGETVDQVWVKSRVTGAPELVRGNLFGASAALEDRHPISGLDPINCSAQLGVPGLWSENLPHFRMGFTPSSGAELQSEYLVPRRHAVAALCAVRELSPMIRPLLQVSEIRTIAADELWMSPQYGQNVVGIHFTWAPEPRAVHVVLVEIESALRCFDSRPHWGKLFVAQSETIAPLYQRLPDFRALIDRIDPRGAFRNDWLETRVLGSS